MNIIVTDKSGRALTIEEIQAAILPNRPKREADAINILRNKGFSVTIEHDIKEVEVIEHDIKEVEVIEHARENSEGELVDENGNVIEGGHVLS